MKVTIFKNVIGEDRPSMQLYADELIKHMPANVSGFTIKAKSFPIIKHYFAKEFIYPLVAKAHQADINHISDQSYAGLIRYLDPKKTVITCHDTIPLQDASVTSKLGRIRYWYNIKNLPKAAKIIADSKYTKNQILKYFNYPQEDIVVVYIGISEQFKPPDEKQALRERYDIKENSILHVGNSFFYKNVEGILELLKQHKEINLVKVGQFTEKQNRFIKRCDLEERIKRLEHIKDNELVYIYNAVDMLVFPSFYEGFGIPVLEAMASGCPVVCSNRASLPEIGGKAALYVKPDDIDNISNAVKKVLGDSNLRDEMVEKGLEQARNFSWEKCAEQTYKVYEEVYEKT